MTQVREREGRGSSRDDAGPERGRSLTDAGSALPIFDRFASVAARMVAGAWFFLLCVVLVIVWLPSYFLFRSIDTWQLIINTVTTIVTFLLVALLQNTQMRSDAALQDKLNVIADALGDLMGELADDHPELRRHCDELRSAVGLEDREHS
jgi:hypothetical protein